MEGPNFSKCNPIRNVLHVEALPPLVSCVLVPQHPHFLVAQPVWKLPAHHHLLSSWPWCLPLGLPVSLASPAIGVSVPLLLDPVHLLPAAIPYHVLDGPVCPELVPRLQIPQSWKIPGVGMPMLCLVVWEHCPRLHLYPLVLGS
jgi:hypothetical protein